MTDTQDVWELIAMQPPDDSDYGDGDSNLLSYPLISSVSKSLHSMIQRLISIQTRSALFITAMFKKQVVRGYFQGYAIWAFNGPQQYMETDQSRPTNRTVLTNRTPRAMRRWKRTYRQRPF